MAVKFSACGPGNVRILGTGQVIDISSKGMAFRTPDVPQPGMTVTAALNWPAVLDHDCRLQLRVDGEVIRAGPDMAVISIRRYEFRTSGRVTATTRDEMQVMTREFNQIVNAALPA